MFSVMLKKALTEKRKAIKKGIPKYLLNLIDQKIKMAIFCRGNPCLRPWMDEKTKKIFRKIGYQKAIQNIMIAREILDAYLRSPKDEKK